MTISTQPHNSDTVSTDPLLRANHTAVYTPEPRVWTVKHIAARLNRSPAWFYDHMPRLRQLGFPSKDTILGGWDSLAIEAWLDRRSGVAATTNVESQMLEAVRGDC